MKKHSENWVNPKSKKKEKIEIWKYSFEDWEKGEISGKLITGKHLVHNITENKYRYDDLPYSEYEKISKAREKIYWEKVEKEFNTYKIHFNGTYERSGNKELLLKIEIEKIEKHLLNNSLYEKLIVRGNKEYHFTDSPNCHVHIGVGDFHHIKIEAFAKYLDWLKAYPTQIIKQESFEGNSFWEFIEKSGLIEKFKEVGATINPTHNFELLKETRQNLFEEQKQSFIARRKSDKLQTNDFEINSLYLMWLNNELSVIESWLSDKYPNGKPKKKPSNSEQIELMKYNHFVISEINKTVPAIEQRTVLSDSDRRKLKISIAIIGLKEDYRKSINTENTSSPVFYHIKEVLKEFGISPMEAREAMLDMKGTYSPKMNANVIEPIISYLERINPEAEQNEAGRPDPAIQSKLSDISNNFDSTDIKKVYNHFKIELVEKKYLAENDLIAYLKSAFDKKEIPKTSFQLKNTPTKQKIITIFYQYYKNIAGKPHGKQKEYAALLGDYFKGYTTKNVSSNFNK